MEDFAAYFWMIASFINMLIFFIMSYNTKKLMYLFTAITWLSCAMWGMTVMAINIPWIRILNTIIIPINAGLFGLMATVMKANEAIRRKPMR